MMNFRSKKSIDFVAASKNFEESVNQTKRIHDSWFRRYGWLLNEYEQILEEGKELCRERKGELKIPESKKNERTCLPYPETTSGQVGGNVESEYIKLILHYLQQCSSKQLSNYSTVSYMQGFVEYYKSDCIMN
ncbi:uncharacterized protein LOC124177271 [Neodiprion fabricii]|uniref:uncharacterized protein LOC124177271 n=1 Tax=Neodiprion fabricii TaxID=2872261 RepID=UPI001ED8EC83|nr:uncharacterized protein LOC124177271 [Neodiprion fabricii]